MLCIRGTSHGPVPVCHKSVFYRKGWTNRAGFWHVSFLPSVLHCVKRKFYYRFLIFCCVYTGCSDVTESTVMLRSPFCGYKKIQCVELNSENFSCYSNKIGSVSLRKCPYDHRLTNKAYLCAITVTSISQSFLPTRWRQKSTGTDIWNKITSLSPYL